MTELILSMLWSLLPGAALKISTSLLFLERAICVASPFQAWVVMELTPKEKGVLELAMMGS